MEGSCSNSCKWASDPPRGPTTAFPPLLNQIHREPLVPGHDQLFMDGLSLFPASSLQEKPTESCVFLRGQYSRPTEDIGLLNIPSIHETMNNSSEILDPARQTSLHNDWEECTRQQGEMSDETFCVERRDGTATRESQFEADDRSRGTTSELAPREPQKRLRRQRANDRERRRMKSLNGALNNLKRCIPLPKTKRRVTKLEILRIACHYIQTLWNTLNNGSDDQPEHMLERNVNRNQVVNGMTVTQRLNLLSSNLKFNFQL